MPKRKNHIYFVRWGNLNPVKHKEARAADEDEWIHVAPCYKGIYAFPRGYVEPFLLGGKYGEKRLRLIKDNGRLLTEKEFYNDTYDAVRPRYVKLMKRLGVRKRDLAHVEMDGDFYMAYRDNPKRFEYSGEIWHHLGDYIDRTDILDSKHGWYKTSFDVYLEALRRCDVHERFEIYMMAEKGERHCDPHTQPSIFGKDYYEVFIEHLK